MNVAYASNSGNNSTGAVGDASKPYLTIQAAINALNGVGGGLVLLDYGTFASPTTTYSNIRVIGAGMPRYNWTISHTASDGTTSYTAPTKLISGTILQGTYNIVDCKNIGVCNLGVDVGSDYVGTDTTKEGNGLVIYRSASITGDDDITFNAYTPLEGVEVKDVIVLLKNASSAYHCFLMEGLFHPNVENVTTQYGVHGVAVKATGGTLKNLDTYNHVYDGLIIKGNNYALCSKVRVDGFRYTGSSTNPSAAIVIQNKCTVNDLSDVEVKNGFITGASVSVNFISDHGAPISRCTLSNIKGGGTFTNTSLATNRTFIDCWNGTTQVTS